MATNVHLTPELERFARECVECGRYNNVSEVVRASLRLLQDAEDRRRQVRRMLDEAMEEADRDGGPGDAKPRRAGFRAAAWQC